MKSCTPGEWYKEPGGRVLVEGSSHPYLQAFDKHGKHLNREFTRVQLLMVREPDTGQPATKQTEQIDKLKLVIQEHGSLVFKAGGRRMPPPSCSDLPYRSASDVKSPFLTTAPENLKHIWGAFSN